MRCLGGRRRLARGLTGIARHLAGTSILVRGVAGTCDRSTEAEQQDCACEQRLVDGDLIGRDHELLLRTAAAVILLAGILTKERQHEEQLFRSSSKNAPAPPSRTPHSV